MEVNKIYFAKVKDGGVIPSKRDEDGGYDVYANFLEDYIEILPNEIKMISTGIASAFNEHWRVVFQERGSTGIIGLKVNAGLIDSGFRNEWMVLLNNTSKYKIIIDKNADKNTTEKYNWFKSILKGYKGVIRYPYSKAICQAKLQEVPNIEIITTDYETLKSFKSERGMGLLGSSGK